MKPFQSLKIKHPDAGLIDLELYFHSEVLKLDSLHYGCWPSELALSLENLKIAQRIYTDTLLEMIPDGVSTILDVGCGMGDNARTLSSKGYIVTAISPDAEHEKFVNEVPGIAFVRTRFEDFAYTDTFDLILMSESQNYFETKAGLSQCRKLLKPQGYLLVSGMFGRHNSEHTADINTEHEYLSAAEEHGLSLISSNDITDEVLPNIELAKAMYLNHIKPLFKLIYYFASSKGGWKLKLLRFIFSKQVREIAKIGEFIDGRLDPERFRENVKYKRLLFQFVAP